MDRLDSPEATTALHTIAKVLDEIGWTTVCLIIARIEGDEGTTIGVSTSLSGAAVKALIDELDKHRKEEVVH